MCEISVIMPVYNKSRYISKMITSILNQTFTNFELLLIDDGSTDVSGKFCDEFSEKDKRILVFHRENRGVSSARNYGISKASGKYICFVDADDRICSRYLEKLYMAIVTNHADMATSSYLEVKKKASKIYGVRPDCGNELLNIIVSNTLCNLWNKLFIKEKIVHLFDESLSTCEDSIFCIRYFIDNNAKLAWVDEPLYKYIRHEQGLTKSLQKNALDGINQWFYYSMVVSRKIDNTELMNVAMHHARITYFYAIYTFVYQNIALRPLNIKTIKLIANINVRKRNQKIIKELLKFLIINPKAEQITKTAYLYCIFSLGHMHAAIYMLARLKRYLRG